MELSYVLNTQIRIKYAGVISASLREAGMGGNARLLLTVWQFGFCAIYSEIAK